MADTGRAAPGPAGARSAGTPSGGTAWAAGTARKSPAPLVTDAGLLPVRGTPHHPRRGVAVMMAGIA